LSTGEGGAIALMNAQQADRLRSLRQNAMPINAWSRFTHSKSLPDLNLSELGYKMNYTDLQAAIGRVQLKRQAEFQAIRTDIGRLYYESLSPLDPAVRFQRDILHPYHARHLVAVRLPVEQMTLSRDQFLLALRDRNIGASIHYKPLHGMPLYRNS